MNPSRVVFTIPGFVEVVHEPDLDAVRLRYSRLYDEEGINIPRAVHKAASYAKQNGISNWIADTAKPTDSLSEKDAAWVATQEFRDILLNSPIITFVLLAPGPETGVDTSWIPDWRDATEAGFDGNIKVHVAESENDIKALLA